MKKHLSKKFPPLPSGDIEQVLRALRVPFIQNSDGSLTAQGDIDLNGRGLVQLPDFSNVHVLGSFDCGGNKLTSLEGGPETVGKSYNCKDNQLMSLKGAPPFIPGFFYCENNLLTSLEGGPERVMGHYACSDNLLVTLKGGPRFVAGNFDCAKNLLHTLEHAPEHVLKSFDCNHNRITSLKGVPAAVPVILNCRSNALASLEHAPQKFRHVLSDFGDFTEPKEVADLIRVQTAARDAATAVSATVLKQPLRVGKPVHLRRNP